MGTLVEHPLMAVQVVTPAQRCIVCGLQTSDALLAYGPLVANHYGASFSLLAWSGAGILRKGGPQNLLSYQMPACDMSLLKLCAPCAATLWRPFACP